MHLTILYCVDLLLYADCRVCWESLCLKQVVCDVGIKYFFSHTLVKFGSEDDSFYVILCYVLDAAAVA